MTVKADTPSGRRAFSIKTAVGLSAARFSPLPVAPRSAAKRAAAVPSATRGEVKGDEYVIKHAKAAGHGAALKAAARAERRRCAAILGSKHAAGRVVMACELAFDTETTISADRAIQLLASAPREQVRHASLSAVTPNAGDGLGARLIANAKARAAKKSVVTEPLTTEGKTPGQRLVANAKARADRAGSAYGALPARRK